MTDTDLYADLDEQLGYDADHRDSSQYCKHGTFIGSWWGPDYLCQWCEDGVSVAEMRTIQREAALRQAHDIEDKFNTLAEHLLADLGWRSDVAHFLTAWADHPSNYTAARTLGYLEDN